MKKILEKIKGGVLIYKHNIKHAIKHANNKNARNSVNGGREYEIC